MDYLRIGEFLKELRIENKLTQKEVAEILVVTPQTISKWELGTSLPSIDMLHGLSKIYHITVDEILNCKINKVDQENKDNNSFEPRNVLSYIIYAILFAIGITIVFVDYLLIDSRVIDYGINNYPFYDIEIFFSIPVMLTNWLVLTLNIFLPILLITLFVLDKRKKNLLVITIFSILLLITFQIPIIASPGFMGAKIGLVLHLLYTLMLVLSMIINLDFLNIDVYRLLESNKKEVISSVIMIILTILLPFNYYNVSYYFDSLEQFLFFFMLLAPCIIIYESIFGKNQFAKVYYVILGIALVFCTLVNTFNSPLLKGSLIQLIYLLYLVILNYKQKMISFNYNKFKLFDYLYIEISSLVVYCYYYINPGSLLYLVEGVSIFITVFIILIAIIVRIANFKLITKIVDLIWITWILYFTLIIIYAPDFNPYDATDVIFLLIPPILIGFYLICYLFNKLINPRKNKERMLKKYIKYKKII